MKELIDTLWNVNIFALQFLTTDSVELIDTLWNVNSLLAMAKNGKIRINRYIMECKFKSV